jgi:hypothetical protein
MLIIEIGSTCGASVRLTLFFTAFHLFTYTFHDHRFLNNTWEEFRTHSTSQASAFCLLRKFFTGFHQKFQNIMTASLSFGAITDITITGLLIYYLRRNCPKISTRYILRFPSDRFCMKLNFQLSAAQDISLSSYSAIW